MSLNLENTLQKKEENITLKKTRFKSKKEIIDEYFKTGELKAKCGNISDCWLFLDELPNTVTKLEEKYSNCSECKVYRKFWY